MPFDWFTRVNRCRDVIDEIISLPESADFSVPKLRQLPSVASGAFGTQVEGFAGVPSLSYHGHVNCVKVRHSSNKPLHTCHIL